MPGTAPGEGFFQPCQALPVHLPGQPHGALTVVEADRLATVEGREAGPFACGKRGFLCQPQLLGQHDARGPAQWRNRRGIRTKSSLNPDRQVEPLPQTLQEQEA